MFIMMYADTFFKYIFRRGGENKISSSVTLFCTDDVPYYNYHQYIIRSFIFLTCRVAGF